MRNLERTFFLLALVSSLTALAGSTPRPDPSSSPSREASVDLGPLSAPEARQLAREFARLQSLEVRALETRQEGEAKTLKQSQNAEQTRWELSEREERRKVFASSAKGPEKRVWMKAHIERRKVRLQEAKEAREALATRQHEALASLKRSQAEKFRAFTESIRKGERPSRQLWPE